jgi:protein-S-isoprenylcysteine O-methyltransferase Ste14
MTRARSLFASLLFTVLVPGTVAGFIPWLLTHWRRAHDFADPIALRMVGFVLVALGLPVLLHSIFRFAVEGLGTPAPIAPTRHLVVGGPNQFVRNPMYIAVVLMIFGQALFLGQMPLVWYGAFCAIVQTVFVHAYEEPTLANQFGKEYRQYKNAVPAWLPRLTPWHPPAT